MAQEVLRNYDQSSGGEPYRFSLLDLRWTVTASSDWRGDDIGSNIALQESKTVFVVFTPTGQIVKNCPPAQISESAWLLEGKDLSRRAYSGNEESILLPGDGLPTRCSYQI